ncbi:ABC transporter permease [Allohahella marinimesophila]
MLLKVALRSLLNRKATAILTVLSIMVSGFVIFGVEHIRQEAKSSFSRTVSGTDLIVGARTGQLNLLLYSVFRIGNATNNISWQSYQDLAARSDVAWTIPLSLGDSHRGYRVLGTSQDYYEHFRFGRQQALELAEGSSEMGVFGAVLGAEVANKLSYEVGDPIVLSHGTGKVSFSNHTDKPFEVIGILQPTGTPVDQTVHVSLDGIEAIHIDWQNGVKMPGPGISAEQVVERDLTPEAITAFMVGLKSKIATFRFQREVNEYRQEPLLAILPGVALSELWQMMGALENILMVISGLVLVASLLGMSTMLLASMRERQRELAVIRAVGAHPSFVFLLIELEALMLTAAGIAGAIAALWLTLISAQDLFSERYGLFIDLDFMSARVLIIIGIMFAATAVLALIPGLSAYRASLNQGLVVKT